MRAGFVKSIPAGRSLNPQAFRPLLATGVIIMLAALADQWARGGA